MRNGVLLNVDSLGENDSTEIIVNAAVEIFTFFPSEMEIVDSCFSWTCCLGRRNWFLLSWVWFSSLWCVMLVLPQIKHKHSLYPFYWVMGLSPSYVCNVRGVYYITKSGGEL